MYHVRLFVPWCPPDTANRVEMNIVHAAGDVVRTSTTRLRLEHEPEWGSVYEFEASSLGLVSDVAEETSRLLGEPIHFTIDGRSFHALGTGEASDVGDDADYGAALEASTLDDDFALVRGEV